MAGIPEILQFSGEVNGALMVVSNVEIPLFSEIIKVPEGGGLENEMVPLTIKESFTQNPVFRENPVIGGGDMKFVVMVQFGSALKVAVKAQFVPVWGKPVKLKGSGEANGALNTWGAPEHGVMVNVPDAGALLK